MSVVENIPSNLVRYMQGLLNKEGFPGSGGPTGVAWGLGPSGFVITVLRTGRSPLCGPIVKSVGVVSVNI